MKRISIVFTTLFAVTAFFISCQQQDLFDDVILKSSEDVENNIIVNYPEHVYAGENFYRAGGAILPAY